MSSSFRDPAGFVFFRDGLYQRAVTDRGRADYRHLMRSGLYDALVRDQLLIAHEELPAAAPLHRILLPEQIPFVSYPYEWGFEQLRDAALLTLDVASRALSHGMMLKDASAFNVQFQGGHPVFVDTLSFTAAAPGPWLGYEQFCRHFLAPLLLMAHVSPTANQLFRIHLDGVPLDAASRALPWHTWLRPGALLHLHAHSRAAAHAARKAGPIARRPVAIGPLLDSLREAIAGLRPRRESAWVHYRTQSTHYSADSLAWKERQVIDAVSAHPGGLVHDIGANTGHFSRLAARAGARVVAFDADPLCVDACYQRERAAGDRTLLPLLMDVANPSAAAGFELSERLSLLQRPAASLVLALAVTHHLRLTDNIPFRLLAGFFRRLGSSLLIEYVAPGDPMLDLLLRGRSQPLPEDYSLDAFLRSFDRDFRLIGCHPVPGAHRWMCHFAA